MNTLDLKGIVANGGVIEISAKSFTLLDLKGIASAGKGHDGGLIINDANTLTALDCKCIAAFNPGHVTFNFC